MPVPTAPVVTRTDELRDQLLALTRASSTPQALAFRARLLLRIADHDRPPIAPSPASSVARATPSPCGEPASSATDGPDSTTPPAPADRRSLPPDERLEVVTLATERSDDHDGPATRWSLDDLARERVNRHADEAVRRSTIHRLRADADRTPHRSVYGLNSRDPDFDAKAAAIGDRSVRSPVRFQQGELVISTDEKTGMPILQRKYPTRPVRPGHPEKRAHESIRHGTRALIASFVVPTGEVVWDVGPTRTSVDFARHLGPVATHVRGWEKITRVVDNSNTHGSREVCRVLADLNRRPFEPNPLSTGSERKAFLTDSGHPFRLVFPPTHGSWWNQVEVWFGVLSRRFLKGGDFASAAEFERRLTAYLEACNGRGKHPHRWTDTGQPLVRGTPFRQTRRQRRHGRAWLGPRPKRFERLLDPPRPYQRRTKP